MSKTKIIRSLSSLLLLTTILIGCKQEEPSSNLPKNVMTIGSRGEFPIDCAFQNLMSIIDIEQSRCIELVFYTGITANDVANIYDWGEEINDPYGFISFYTIVFNLDDLDSGQYKYIDIDDERYDDMANETHYYESLACHRPYGDLTDENDEYFELDFSGELTVQVIEKGKKYKVEFKGVTAQGDSVQLYYNGNLYYYDFISKWGVNRR